MNVLVPYKASKFKEHYNKSLESLTKIGVKGLLGLVYLDLGLLHKNNKRLYNG